MNKLAIFRVSLSTRPFSIVSHTCSGRGANQRSHYVLSFNMWHYYIFLFSSLIITKSESFIIKWPWFTIELWFENNKLNLILYNVPEKKSNIHCSAVAAFRRLDINFSFCSDVSLDVCWMQSSQSCWKKPFSSEESFWLRLTLPVHVHLWTFYFIMKFEIKFFFLLHGLSALAAFSRRHYDPEHSAQACWEIHVRRPDKGGQRIYRHGRGGQR